jgi:transcriptional regulator GlxA family with amidase domain
MRAHLGERIRLAEVARAARVSPRTLARRFEASLGFSPLRFLRRLRAERAQHLLTTSDLSFDAVASRVGYEDPVALRRILRRELDTGARELRRRG